MPGLILKNHKIVLDTIYPKQIGRSTKPFQINIDNEHAIKINNKKEFVELDLKVINGTFGKCIGLNISMPRKITSPKAIFESP